MKRILFYAFFLLTATNSIAQTPLSGTSIYVRGGRDFYIDGIKVSGITPTSVSDTLNKRCPITISDFNMDEIKKHSQLIQLVKTDSEIILETIEIIIGGLPGTYGDIICSNQLRISRSFSFHIKYPTAIKAKSCISIAIIRVFYFTD